MNENLRQLLILLGDPTTAGVVGGVISTTLVQLWKKLLRIPAGTAVHEKRFASVIASLLVTLAGAAANDQWTLIDFSSIFMLSLLTANGVHSLIGRSAESLTPGSPQKAQKSAPIVSTDDAPV